MLEERERACDEAVLDHGHDAHDYAEGILAVCRHCHELSHAQGTASALSGDLTRRIRAIIRPRAPPVSLGFCKAFALSACTLALGLTPMIAGALEGAARRHAQLLSDVARARHCGSFSVAGGGRHGVALPRAGDGTSWSSSQQHVARTGGPVVRRAGGTLNGGEWLDDDALRHPRATRNRGRRSGQLRSRRAARCGQQTAGLALRSADPRESPVPSPVWAECPGSETDRLKSFPLPFTPACRLYLLQLWLR